MEISFNFILFILFYSISENVIFYNTSQVTILKTALTEVDNVSF